MTDLHRISYALTAAVALICVAGTASGQTAQQPLQFEVATIKPVDANGPHQNDLTVYPNGRIVLHGLSLRSLTITAFHIGSWQLSGGDTWVEKDLYDIEAKAPVTDPPVSYDVRHTWWQIEDPRLRAMLQSLLIERFHLKLVPQSTTGQVYLLAVGGKTSLMHPTELPPGMYDEGHSGDIGHAGDRWVIYNTSMPQLAQFAGDIIVHRPVIDKSGLTGYFDAKWTQTLIDPNNYDGMDSFEEFLHALGLKLTKSTGPVQMFVIDNADPPSPN